MRIAQVAPVTEPVPPKGYGGTELVVSHITEELVKRGHEVVLFASGDSITDAHLIECAPFGLRSDKVPEHRWSAYELRVIMKMMERLSEFDIIHNHLGYLALPFLDQSGVPSVTTNHNAVAAHCAEIYLKYGHLPYVSISDAYRQLNYPNELNYVGRVYNGIDVTKFTAKKNATPPAKDHLLFLGRVSYDKGTAEAVQIAKAVGMPLKIAGKIDHSDREYFETEVKPHLRDGSIEYIGEVNMEQKIQLYRDAKAIVYPINFEEPFGLVMVEALASGTPLLARARGSVSEVLSNDCSVIGNSTEELIDRFSEIENITAEACMERAQLFSIENMVDGYEAIYRALVGTESASLVAA
jgi:glycosyltransferase involved in cell wall biosynthesis